MAVPGLELLGEIAQCSRPAAGGDASDPRGRSGLRAKVLLLARGQAPPPGVVADRVVVGSEEVIKKVCTLPPTSTRTPLVAI